MTIAANHIQLNQKYQSQQTHSHTHSLRHTPTHTCRKALHTGKFSSICSALVALSIHLYTLVYELKSGPSLVN